MAETPKGIQVSESGGYAAASAGPEEDSAAFTTSDAHANTTPRPTSDKPRGPIADPMAELRRSARPPPPEVEPPPLRRWLAILGISGLALSALGFSGLLVAGFVAWRISIAAPEDADGGPETHQGIPVRRTLGGKR